MCVHMRACVCVCVWMCRDREKHSEIKKQGAAWEMESESEGKIWDGEMETEKEEGTRVDYSHMSQE